MKKIILLILVAALFQSCGNRLEGSFVNAYSIACGGVENIDYITNSANNNHVRCADTSIHYLNDIIK